jgi:hypothetical protein
MSLWHRIVNVGGNYGAATGACHPAVTPATPMVMPMARVTYHQPQSYPWGTLAYEDIPVMFAADGAAVPAALPGAWGAVPAAGRASPAHA